MKSSELLQFIFISILAVSPFILKLLNNEKNKEEKIRELKQNFPDFFDFFSIVEIKNNEILEKKILIIGQEIRNDNGLSKFKDIYKKLSIIIFSY